MAFQSARISMSVRQRLKPGEIMCVVPRLQKASAVKASVESDHAAHSCKRTERFDLPRREFGLSNGRSGFDREIVSGERRQGLEIDLV